MFEHSLDVLWIGECVRQKEPHGSQGSIGIWPSTQKSPQDPRESTPLVLAFVNNFVVCLDLILNVRRQNLLHRIII
jgi:hypothetical protein